MFKVNVTCDCRTPREEAIYGPHVCTMVWGTDHVGGPIEIAPLGDSRIKAFKGSELPDVLEAVSKWMRRGGKVKKVEVIQY